MQRCAKENKSAMITSRFDVGHTLPRKITKDEIIESQDDHKGYTSIIRRVNNLLPVWKVECTFPVLERKVLISPE